MTSSRQFERAKLTVVDTGDDIPLHFNPASLQYTVSNSTKAGSGGRSQQFVSNLDGKLSMELVFDTTDTGEDVRAATVKVAKLMLKPTEAGAPPQARFSWGQYTFTGTVNQFKETIDFFSEDGVPLRSAVNLSMTEQKETFANGAAQSADVRGADAIDVATPSGQSTSQTAGMAGNPGAGRALASANGLESMRFNGGASLTVSGGVSLSGPVAFASGGAALGLSVGSGLGLSAGGSLGLSAGAGLSLGVGRASVGVPATLGAFAQLRTTSSEPTSRRTLEPSAFRASSGSTKLIASAGATFQVGGRVVGQAGGGFVSDVGQYSSLSSRISFSED